MDENMDLNTKLDALIQAVTSVVQKVDEQQARIDEMDSVLYDGLIGPANEAIAQNEYDSALSDFRTKYAEKLGPFEGASKAIEGDDFDIYKSAFDGYNEGEYDFSPDEYVDKVAASLTDQIAKIKEAVADQAGVSPEDVDVEVNAENGEVEIDVDNKTTEEKPGDNVTEEVEEKTEDEPKSEETTAPEDKPETPAGDVGETLEDFEASLRKEAEKDKDRSWIRG